jgi:hypothetical protein
MRHLIFNSNERTCVYCQGEIWTEDRRSNGQKKINGKLNNTHSSSNIIPTMTAHIEERMDGPCSAQWGDKKWMQHSGLKTSRNEIMWRTRLRCEDIIKMGLRGIV